MREKVVGTTFRTHPDVASFAGTIDNTGEIPVFTGRAILMNMIRTQLPLWQR